MRGRGAAWALVWSTVLAGCAVPPQQRADELAGAVGLQRQILSAGQFKLTTYARITDPLEPVHVYIEGDGRAWLTPTRPSDDPTPRHMLGLQLAVADPAPNVVYLARPCQFTRNDSKCDVRYWTGRRYAPEVVASLSVAISALKPESPYRVWNPRAPNPMVDLIGYSGGGALAVLVAACRQDVRSLRTVAANLDVEAVNRLHHVSSMPESLNPMTFTVMVQSIPQIHFSGGRDTVVPPEIASRFVAALGGACGQAQTVAGMNHEGDWGRLWPQLLLQIPHC